MTINDIKNAVETAQAESLPTLVTIGLEEFLAKDLPPRELLLDPWLPKAGLCMIHAYRGVGKTHTSLGIAYAVAAGVKFLGWEAHIPKNVLYIDGEMPACVLQERLANIVAMNNGLKPIGKLIIVTPDFQTAGMPDISTIEGQLAIAPLITEDIDLVIIDNLSCLAPSVKENDANDWAPIQTWALNLRARGKSVLLIHHSGKSGGQRGTSRKEDVLDTVIALERPKDYDSTDGARFIVKYEKSRGFFGDSAKSFEAQLCNDGNDNYFWKTTSLEESNYEKVVGLFNNGLKQKDIVIETSLNKSTVSRYVSRAKEEGLLKRQVSEEE